MISTKIITLKIIKSKTLIELNYFARDGHILIGMIYLAKKQYDNHIDYHIVEKELLF